MHVEPFLGGIHGSVGTVKPDPHEEGLVVFLLQLLDGPLGAFHVGHQVVVVRKDSPVPQGVTMRLGNLFLGARTESARR